MDHENFIFDRYFIIIDFSIYGHNPGHFFLFRPFICKLRPQQGRWLAIAINVKSLPNRLRPELISYFNYSIKLYPPSLNSTHI